MLDAYLDSEIDIAFMTEIFHVDTEMLCFEIKTFWKLRTKAFSRTSIL